MKKFFAVFLMASVLAVLALPVPVVVVTAEDPEGPGTGFELPGTPPISTVDKLVLLFKVLMNWVFALFTFLAVVFLILAGLQFITSGGDAVKVGEARMKLLWAAVGIMVALSSRGLIPLIEDLLGAG